MTGPAQPAASIHPGAVRAIFDHLILALATDPGAGPSFLYSHYSIRWARDGVVGELAYIQLDRDGRRERLVVTDEPRSASSAARRFSPAAWDPADARRTPIVARFERSCLGGPTVRETVTADGLSLTAEWSDLAAPLFAQGPAPRVPSEDITSTLLEARSARATLDGRPVAGKPYPNDGWVAWLGRPLSSCVVAIGEVLLTRP